MFRRISFFGLLVSLIFKDVSNTEFPIWMSIVYPFALLLSWLYYKILYRKYPNMKSTFIESIVIDDISEPMGRYKDTRSSMRLWNIWHYRNYRYSYTSFGDILKAWILE